MKYIQKIQKLGLFLMENGDGMEMAMAVDVGHTQNHKQTLYCSTSLCKGEQDPLLFMGL